MELSGYLLEKSYLCILSAERNLPARASTQSLAGLIAQKQKMPRNMRSIIIAGRQGKGAAIESLCHSFILLFFPD